MGENCWKKKGEESFLVGKTFFLVEKKVPKQHLSHILQKPDQIMVFYFWVYVLLGGDLVECCWWFGGGSTK